MAAVRRWSSRLLPVLFLLVWRTSSAQVLYADQVALEQLNPFIGAEFLNYPIIDEYNIPDVRIISADPQEGDDSEAYDADRLRGADDEEVRLQKEMHVSRREALNRHKYNDLRIKRQIAMQEDPVIQAQEKLKNSIKAAKALTNIEKELGTDPTFIEEKTDKLKNQLGTEMSNLEKLESQQDQPSKKSKYKHMKDVAKEDMKEAQSILSLIVKLEAAKYLANERARQKLQDVQRDRISNAPAVPPMSAASPQSVMPFQNPPYYPMLPSYASPYQSSSYPQYPGSYPGSNPFQGQSSWTNSMGMNEANSQPMTPPPLPQVAGFGAVNPPLAAYSSMQGDQEEAEMEAQNDDVAPAVSPNLNQNVAGKQPDSENLPTQKPPPPKATESVAPVKPNSNAHKELSKVNDNSRPLIAVAAQGPKKPVGPISLLKQSAPLTASPSVTKVQPNTAAASQFFDSFRTNQRVQPPVIAPASPVHSPSFIKAPAMNMHTFKPQVFHTTTPHFLKPALPQQSFKPAVPHITRPQFFSPAVSNMANLQLPRPAVVPVKQPQTVNPVAPFNDENSHDDDEGAANVMQSDMQYPLAFAQPQDASVAYSSEQPLPGQYPSNAYNPWNAQTMPSNAPMYSWNSNAYYPQYPAGYTLPAAPPENPLLRKLLSKLHDTSRASAAVSKIEQAIGLSPNTVRNLIDNVKNQAQQEISRYEQDAKVERQGINAAKSRLQSKEEGSNTQKLKDKLRQEEAKLSSDEQKEKDAKLKVNEVKQIEKILTIIEAAKFSALQRAKSKLNDLSSESSEIRKRDLKDLENDLKTERKRRRNQLTIWMKGSRNKIDTSHLLLAGQHKHNFHIPDGKDGTLQDENPSDVMREDDLAKSRHPFGVEKRTKIPEPSISLRDTLMLRMLHKMDGLFSMQAKILKELQKSHHKNAPKWKWHAHAWKKHKKSGITQEQKKKRSAS